MNVVGLGQAGCNIADLLSQYSQYKIYKIDEFLKEYKSFISFTVHDSIIVDISKEETNLVPKLIGMFADTELGFFKVNASFGADFGNLREVSK